MTLVIALILLMSVPLFVALLKTQPRYRLWAFTGIALTPLLPDLPVLGYLYGWSSWLGTAKGLGISLGDALAIALLLTRRDYRKRMPFWPLLLFYYFSLFTSIFASSNWTATIFVWWQFARMLLLFAVISGEGHFSRVRDHLMMGLAFGLIYQSLFVVLAKLSGVVRSGGTFASPNMLGMVVELSVVTLVGAVLAGNKSKLTYFGVVAGLICAAGTGSRATLAFAIAAIGALLLASLLRRMTARKLKILSIIVLGLVVASPIAIKTLNDRFQGSTMAAPDETRLAFEDAARSMAADYPIGVGANMFVWVSIQEEYAANAGVSWRAEDRSKPVHNAYLLARAETGWHGEFALILMLVIPMLTAFRTAFFDRRIMSGELALGSGCALLAHIVHNNWEFDFHSYGVQSILFINVGIIASLWRLARMPKKRRHQPALPSHISTQRMGSFTPTSRRLFPVSTNGTDLRL